MVEVIAIELVDPDALTDEDAVRGGFASLPALRKWTSSKGTGDLYQIGIGWPVRIRGSRCATTIGSAPTSSPTWTPGSTGWTRPPTQPWTRQALRLIERNPGVVSTELAAEAGQERQYFKIRIRRLKALGLTESLRSATGSRRAVPPISPTPTRECRSVR